MDNQYNKEYRAYLDFALQRYLIEKKGFSEYEAKVRVMQEPEVVEAEAKADNYF